MLLRFLGGSDYRTALIGVLSLSLSRWGRILLYPFRPVTLPLWLAQLGFQVDQKGFSIRDYARWPHGCLRIGGLKLVEVRNRITPVGCINKKCAGFTIVMGVFNNLVKEIAGAHCLPHL